MLEKLFKLQDKRFYVQRYAFALVLWLMYLWPQIMHDLFQVTDGLGQHFVVLLTELPLNIVITIMLLCYPLANAIVEMLLTQFGIVNFRRGLMKRFIKAGRKLLAMRNKKVYDHNRDGFQPLIKQIAEVLITGLLTAVIVYWAIVVFILCGWLIVGGYVGMLYLQNHPVKHHK